MTTSTDLYRLYAREWVIVHTVTMRGNDGRDTFMTCQRWIEDNLDGRVPHGDVQIELNTDRHGLFWGHVKVFKDNLKGEFKYSNHAEVHARSTGLEEYTIVERNSPADHEIRAYGVKKL